jgi:hypothetical protein
VKSGDLVIDQPDEFQLLNYKLPNYSIPYNVRLNRGVAMAKVITAKIVK